MSSICYTKALKKDEFKGNPKTYIWCLRNIIGALNPGYVFIGGNQPTGAGTGQRYQGCPEGHMNLFFSATNLRTAITHGLVVILKATFKDFFQPLTKIRAITA
jgi:hypothetical protein